MPWKFNNDQAIYKQIVARLKVKIISNELMSGSKLKSVRDLAEEAGVNPNTMQRALSELEREGLIYTERTSGRYVTQDCILIQKIREEYARNQIDTICKELMRIGYTKEELDQLIKTNMNKL